METKSNNYFFGIIAFVMAILTLFTLRFLLILPIATGSIFGIIGLFKKGNKILSIISLLFLFFVVYSELENSVQNEVLENKLYEVKYEVIGQSFDVTYQNSTGGTDNVKGSVQWEKQLTLKGTDFAYLSAQNSRNSKEITVNLYIDNILCKTATSSGQYAIANVSCFPKSCK